MIVSRSICLSLVGVGFVSLGCGGGVQAGISSESAHASASMMRSPDGGGSSTLGEVRLADEACADRDLTPETKLLSHADFAAHLTKQNIAFTVQVERADLHLYDLDLHGRKTRLRVATLDTPREAGRHLHKALLEHGQGYWGVHRSNLAVLGPEADVDDAIGFSLETGLACWGVLTMADRDDTFMVAGGYFEL